MGGLAPEILPGDIRGVLFDVDGTLYRQFPVRVMAAARLLLRALAGMSFGDVRVLFEFRRTREELRGLGPGHDIGELQYSLPAERLGVPVGRVREVVRLHIYEKPLHDLGLFSCGSVPSALGRLKDKNYKLGVYSDYRPEDKLKALGMDISLFDVVAHSDMPEIDAFKPNAEGFRYCAGAMGLEPSRVLYVGDRAEIDMKGAIGAGMRGALLTGSSRGRTGEEYIVARDLLSLEAALPAVPHG